MKNPRNQAGGMYPTGMLSCLYKCLSYCCFVLMFGKLFLPGKSKIHFSKSSNVCLQIKWNSTKSNSNDVERNQISEKRNKFLKM